MLLLTFACASLEARNVGPLNPRPTVQLKTFYPTRRLALLGRVIPALSSVCRPSTTSLACLTSRRQGMEAYSLPRILVSIIYLCASGVFPAVFKIRELHGLTTLLVAATASHDPSFPFDLSFLLQQAQSRPTIVLSTSTFWVCGMAKSERMPLPILVELAGQLFSMKGRYTCQ